jgi:hypothetical protein
MSGARLRNHISGHRSQKPKAYVPLELRCYGGFWLAVSEYLATTRGSPEAVEKIGRIVGREPAKPRKAK